MPLRDVLARARRALDAAGIADPAREARLLATHALGVGLDGLLRLGVDAPVDPRPIEALVARRAAREPFARITGVQGFWSLDLAVDGATLVPRADTETVVAAALAARAGAPPRRVLDLGTGTGAILLALLAEWPDACGVGLDRSAAACRLARGNARRNGLAARAAFVCGDWDRPLSPAGRFDVVVSNPPYIPAGAIPSLMPEVARFEPLSALDGGADGLDAYRRLLPRLPSLLAADGRAVFEIGAGQAPAIGGIASGAGLAVLREAADLGGHVRALVLRAAHKALGSGRGGG